MKQDVIKEATKKAQKDAEGMKYETLDEMRRFIVERRALHARRLHATDRSI